MSDLAIKNHRFVDVPFMQARWQGGSIVPTCLIAHDTAGRLDKFNSANYLRDNSSKTSVHLVLERDGTVEQQVAFNRRANHAGRSEYHGRAWCNNFTIGVEIVNPGRMTKGKAGFARAWYGQEFSIEEHGIQWIESDEHGAGFWMPYTEAQLTVFEDIAVSLFNKYDSLIDLRTHWYISPGRKFDTNPLFPIEQLRSRIMGREDFSEDAADEVSLEIKGDNMLRVDTPGDTLNMRRWPSFNPNILTAVPHGTIVPAIRAGNFYGRDWTLINYGGQQGWVVDKYLQDT